MADATLDATPAPKRRRLDGTDEAQPTTGLAEKYKDLWLADGNIVLQCAEGAFRVHRSLLAAQSEVFRDMFALAIPAVDADGLPTVQVSDDTDQMYQFLCCLIFHKYPSKNSKKYTDYILDIFELSRKYAVSIMRAACVDILKELFPDTLEDYQHTFRKRRQLVSFRASIRCVEAASTNGLPTLLPACYLYIASDWYDHMLDLKMTAEWPPEIPLAFYATIVRSMQQLSRLKREIDEGFSREWLVEWDISRSHEHHAAQLLTYYQGSNNSGVYPEEDLTLFDPDWKATDIVDGCGTEELCTECVTIWDKAQREAWIIAWNGLPEKLRLGKWQTLRQQESQASFTA
ncbi:hypothetical protein PENSPDRAFT_641447 [Peniophora sp. CONT]|nr:hypothetical protein PENSPDRAFT_641447 [Peniophora sp. CONT]